MPSCIARHFLHNCRRCTHCSAPIDLPGVVAEGGPCSSKRVRLKGSMNVVIPSIGAVILRMEFWAIHYTVIATRQRSMAVFVQQPLSFDCRGDA